MSDIEHVYRCRGCLRQPGDWHRWECRLQKLGGTGRVRDSEADAWALVPKDQHLLARATHDLGKDT